MNLTSDINNSEWRKQVSNKLFVFGLIVMCVGLPLSVFLMSISQFIMLAAWLLRGDFKIRSSKFISNKMALSFAAIYVMHVVGLLWTTDFNYALRDLRIKGPILIIAFIFSTMDVLNRKIFCLVVKIFVLAVVASTFIDAAVWLGLTHRQITDIRQISIFISHIRLSLMICLVVYACAYFIYDTETKTWQKIVSAVIIIWSIIFLVILEAATGLAILAITSFLILAYYFITKKNYWALILIIIASLAVGLYIGKDTNKIYEGCTIPVPLNPDTLPKFTPRGNPYEHVYDKRYLENGNCTSIYICWDEFKSEWNKRSKINFDSTDANGNKLIFTAVRYMTSKGLRKDADGVKALSDDDIHNIEKGIPSINRIRYGSIGGRLFELVWEYHNYSVTGNASSSSFMQRIEFWKASVNVIKQNMLFGVGTGDNQLALDNYYQISKSKLNKQHWLRSHNQFLAIGVSFGLVGLLLFCICLFYPFIKQFTLRNYFYITFFITAVISMLTEDTLETQAGLSFFIFFSGLYLFLQPKS